MRKAFSMITAIFIILLMATLAAFILNISGKAVKATVFQYKKEQTVLYAKSYAELAILAATANESNVTNCAENINGRIGTDVDNGIGYDIETRISYIGNNLQCSTTSAILPANRRLNINPIELGDAVYIIVDVYVRHKDPTQVAASSAAATPWVTYHRRTLQKL